MVLHDYMKHVKQSWAHSVTFLPWKFRRQRNVTALCSKFEPTQEKAGVINNINYVFQLDIIGAMRSLGHC